MSVPLPTPRSLDAPGAAGLAACLDPSADACLDDMAARAQALTRRHFGRTVSLYAPLYLSNHCGGGCAYCGYAADRPQARARLDPDALGREFDALAGCGFDDILLLTGERSDEAGFEYLLDSVARAAGRFSAVSVEAFPMTTAEYRRLADAGCTGVTVYQETYDRDVYGRVHRWGPKRDYAARIEAPARALEAGMRTVGLGILLGLADPLADAMALYLHAADLRQRFWRSGISLSFPRIRPEAGGFVPEHPVSERTLARIVFAFRLALPDVPLVLSTREGPRFRDGIAGIGITRMSAGSRTTVGGYADGGTRCGGQFDVEDRRTATEVAATLRRRGLDPVLKNWDAAFRT
ncbi:MAG: 2-iminoacetate synthase ThiH [Verrucomicrobia bacterium]|nr:2-iminoacetate synthase ThiH [Verrucomicrobiota bacterium]